MLRNDPAARLLALLEEERLHLLAGDTAALAGLSARKAALLTAVEALLPEETDAAAMAALGDSARRNEAMIAAALRGVRSAHRRISEARDTATRLQTYDRSGQRQRLAGGGASLEHKA